jgi:hypothetical protein
LDTLTSKLSIGNFSFGNPGSQTWGNWAPEAGETDGWAPEAGGTAGPGAEGTRVAGPLSRVFNIPNKNPSR